MSTATIPLYDIVDALAEIEAQLEERGGELDDEIEARLDAIEADFERKCERICGWRQNLLRSAEAYALEAERLTARKRTLEKSAESIRKYLHAQLDRAGRTKMDTGVFRLAVQRNSQPSVTVAVDPAALPERFRRVTVDADRRALLDAWKNGTGPIPEGVVIEVGHHLRIR